MVNNAVPTIVILLKEGEIYSMEAVDAFVTSINAITDPLQLVRITHDDGNVVYVQRQEVIGCRAPLRSDLDKWRGMQEAEAEAEQDSKRDTRPEFDTSTLDQS